MKLILTALCASFIALPAFASDCEKGKCDKQKQEEGTLAHCGKCEGDKKKDGDCDKKKDGDCDKKKEEGTLASDCDKCKKGGDSDKKKEEGTLA
jgi:hypothetical protein